LQARNWIIPPIANNIFFKRPKEQQYINKPKSTTSTQGVLKKACQENKVQQ